MTEQKPAIIIGKGGLSESLITEIKNQLKIRKEIRIKILRSAKDEMDRKEIAQKVAQSTGSQVIELRGNIFTISKQ